MALELGLVVDDFVDRGLVLDALGKGRKLERGERLGHAGGRDGADDGRQGVAAERVLEDAGQLAVSVADEPAE